MKKVLLVATIIARAFSILPTSSVFALNETIEELSIAVDEPLYDLNIFNITKHSSSVDNVLRWFTIGCLLLTMVILFPIWHYLV